MSPAPTLALPTDGHLPVISETGQTLTTGPRARDRAEEIASGLVALLAERITSSTNAVGPLSSASAYGIDQLLTGRTDNELLNAKVLLGHAVTAIVQKQRGRAR